MTDVTSTATPASLPNDREAVQEIADAKAAILREIGKRIYGQQDVIEHLLIALFSRGHCLMMGVPGLAKTLLISTLAQVLELRFNRIQFTPDLMPADITGTDILEEDHSTGKRFFKFIKGPVFCNLLLADEINRTPPKTQAALLQSMQEYQVTAGGTTYKLDPPFQVFATQNPIEQEGTYPLPEAQLDRFMLNILVDYPDEGEEMEIYRSTTVKQTHETEAVLTAEDIIELQDIVLRVPVGDHVFRYALELVRKTRPAVKESPEFVKEWLEVGAGPRAGQNLILGAKARALMQGRFYATCDDVEQLALPVLRHRLITNFNAETEGVTTDDIVDRLLKEVPKRDEEGE